MRRSNVFRGTAFKPLKRTFWGKVGLYRDRFVRTIAWLGGVPGQIVSRLESTVDSGAEGFSNAVAKTGFAQSDNAAMRAVKITGLALIGVPVTALWGATVLLLKTACSMLSNVVRGIVYGPDHLCKAVYNVLAFVVNKLKKDTGSADENKLAINNALVGTLAMVISAASLGFLRLKTNIDDYDKPLKITGIELNKYMPLVREGREIGKQVYHQVKGRHGSTEDSESEFVDVKKERPEYDGQFQGLASVVSRIGREATLVDKLAPKESGHDYRVRV